jgi:hypothetical protein
MRRRAVINTRDVRRHGLKPSSRETDRSMRPQNRTALQLLRYLLTSPVLIALSGCSGGGLVNPPDVDPQAAAAHAMEHFDSNGDGALEPPELSKCPALIDARASFDIDQDGRIGKDELTDGLSQIFGSQTSLTEWNCNMKLNGRPLAGAKVRLLPIEILGETLPAAEGETDARGSARPTIDPELLPEEYRKKPLMYAGLYRVEITHPRTQLASRYNTASELGCFIDPAARGGTSANFDLKLK